jgi:hypothetical protein
MIRREHREMMQLLQSSPGYQRREEERQMFELWERSNPHLREMRMLDRMAEGWPFGGSEQGVLNIEHPPGPKVQQGEGAVIAAEAPAAPSSLHAVDYETDHGSGSPVGLVIRRKRKRDPRVKRIKDWVRKLRCELLDYRSICDRLGSSERPPRAVWRDLTWPLAYKRHTSAVTKWLSEACNESPQTNEG